MIHKENYLDMCLPVSTNNAKNINQLVYDKESAIALCRIFKIGDFTRMPNFVQIMHKSELKLLNNRFASLSLLGVYVQLNYVH